jgi:hypothetical protein
MKKNKLTLNRQAKRKQALLESNLLGIHLMNVKNVISMDKKQHNPLIFLEFFMP